MIEMKISKIKYVLLKKKKFTIKDVKERIRYTSYTTGC